MDRSPTRREEREDKSGNSSKPNGDNTMGAFFTLGGSSPEIPGISALLLPALPLHFLLVPPSRRRLEQDGRNAILLLPRGKTWNGTGRSGNSSKPNGDNTMGAFFTLHSSVFRFFSRWDLQLKDCSVFTSHWSSCLLVPPLSPSPVFVYPSPALPSRRDLSREDWEQDGRVGML